jgi:hypothetical protein
MKIHGTAKGAALSTKDFGVAFGGAALPSFVCQKAEGSGFGLGGSGGVRTIAGVRVLSGNSAIGKTVTEVKFNLYAQGSPSGNINLAVYNDEVDQGAGGSTLDASTIPSNGDPYEEFTFTMSHTVAENDDIVLEGGTVNDANQVILNQNNNTTEFTDQISINVESGVWFTMARNCYWCYLGS